MSLESADPHNPDTLREKILEKFALFVVYDVIIFYRAMKMTLANEPRKFIYIEYPKNGFQKKLVEMQRCITQRGFKNVDREPR